MNDGELINLDDLPFKKIPFRRWEHLVKESVAVVKEYADLSLSEAERERCLWANAEREIRHWIDGVAVSAHSGDRNAAWTLHRIAQYAVARLNAEADANPELFRPIARKAQGWPEIGCDLGYERDKNDKRRADLQVGYDAYSRATKSPGSKSLRHSDSETHEIRITQYLDWILRELQDTAEILAVDSPSDEEFETRCLNLLRGWKDRGAAFTVLGGCRRQALTGNKERFELMWKWLEWETDKHPERIRELRRTEVMGQVTKAPAFTALRRRLARNSPHASVQATKEHLVEHIEDPTIESKIREGIKRSLKTCLSEWRRPPSKAR